MKTFHEISREYRRKFDDDLPLFGLSDEQVIWMKEEAIKAIDGERGAITREEVNKAFGIEEKPGVDY